MVPLFPRHPYSPERWLRRLDRAAGRMNPILTLLAVGLLILNLICLILLAPRLPITRMTPGLADCLSCAASGVGVAMPATAGLMPPAAH